MQRYFTKLMLLTLFFTLLVSCSSVKKNEDKNAFCRQMKYDIIFNGATSNQHKAMQQRAERGTLNKSYREAGCQ